MSCVTMITICCKVKTKVRMVSRRSTQSVTQRSTRQSELHMTRRPRRLLTPKTLDDTVGLSRKEERELKKALYASLQESRRPRTPLLDDDSTSSYNKEAPQLRKSTRHVPARASFPSPESKKRNATSNANLDDSSQDSVMSSVSSSLESKKKIHAQRKFAQGCSGPSTPGTTPNKKSPISPHSLLERVPKTEDFLTFLCLRGSHLLPANLDFFHFARDESALEESSSDLRTPVHGECDDKNNLARECTPDSNSSSGCSNMNDELRDITSPITTPLKLVQDSRKAARASAGTPETARGIVSLRHGLTRKVVCPGRASSAQHSRKYLFTSDSLSLSTPRLAFGDFMPAKKSASINCLSASFLRSSPAGRLALERNGNFSAHSSPGLTQCRPPSTSSSLPGKVKDSGGGLNHKQRLPTGAFKPLEPVVTRGRTEMRSSSMSPVRKILEGASKKLQKSQNLAIRLNSSLPQKMVKLPNRSREDRARKREKLLAELSQKERIRKKLSSARKLIKRAPVRVPLRPKRRSSLRLKTLAKILGRKRPNYSLVVSGYADVEEYEEEQKKKAAKTALAKAKAEARAKASSSLTTRSSKSSKPTEPEKMRTRSSSTISKDADEKRSEDSGDRDVSQRDRRRLSDKEKTLDQEKDCIGDKAERTAKRSLSSSSSNDSKRKDPLLKAAALDSKRLKREGSGGSEADRRISASSFSRPDSQESTAFKSTHIPGTAVVLEKRVTPKKSAEKSGVLSSTSADQVSRDMERVPVFHPTDEEFFDPITYIENIRNKAEPFGMCLIVPPASWKMESKVNEEIRFTTQVQHLHRLFNRWGPSVEQTKAIVHHLEDVIDNSCTSQIGGVEVDLPQLYRMIRDLGGLQNIVDKKQWVRVAEAMKIPKMAHDRVTRLYDVYCKFVLPYAMLCETERELAQKDVLMQYESSSTEDDAIFKGKSMTLGTFSRIARNVQSMWFRDDPSPEMVEAAYWKIVEGRKSHVSVQCAHVNTRTQSTAFPTRRESPYYRHSWNLNNVPDNKQCILKCLGPVSGTTIPTLHVGMLFSTSCWSTDPHRLPYIHYLHSGANTVWYCIPKSSVTKFHEAMKELCPTLIHKCPLWLSEDTAMVKPEALKARGVDVVRCVQQPRQFAVVFPDVYTATVCCGYSVSESVHYATTEWLSVSMQAAKALRNSEEKELFSVDTLICGLCQDSTDVDTLTAALPMLQDIVTRELDERHQLSAAGLKCERRLAVEDSPGTSASVARKRSHDLAEDSACDVCYKICYLSMVVNEHDEQILCLEHGLKHVQRKRHVKAAKLFYRYTEEELTELVQSTRERLASLQAAKSSSSAAPCKKRLLKKQDSKP